MKRLLCLVAIALTSFQGLAQDASSAAALAARQEASRQAAEEQYKIMAADVSTLTANIAALQESNAKLKAELAKVREEQARAAAAAKDNGVQEALTLLKSKIEDVDRKRESDKKVISDEIQKSIDKLAAMIKESAAAASRARTTTTHKETSAVSSLPDSGYPYTVEPNVTLKMIVQQYNAEFTKKGMKTITMQQVKDANPKIKNWDKLLIGKKIIIPDPGSK